LRKLSRIYLWWSNAQGVSPDNRYWRQPLTVHPKNPQIVFAEGFNHKAVFTTSGGVQTQPGGLCFGAWTEFWGDDDPVGITFYDDPKNSDRLAFAACGDRGIYRVVHTTMPDEKKDFTHKQGDLANPLLVSLQTDPKHSATVYGIAVDQLAALSASPTTLPFWTYLQVGAEFGKTIVNPNDPSILYNICPVGLGPDPQPDAGPKCDATNFINRFTNGTWSKIVADSFNPKDFPFSRSIETDPAAWKALECDPATSEGLLYGGERVWAWPRPVGSFPRSARCC
jgi:hypothetical protein